MMASEKEGLSVSFGLKSFEVLSYSFEKPESNKKIDPNKIGYNIQYGAGGDLEENLFFLDFRIQGQLGKKDPLILGKIHTRTLYNLSEMKKLINKDGNFILPKGLAVTLLSIAISTTRGALAVKSEGNVLSEAVLPLVDPNELYEESTMKGSIEL